MDNIAFILWIVCIFSSLTVVFAVTPLLWRRDSVFGVLVAEAENHRPVVKKAVAFYVVCSVLCGCTLLLVSILLHSVMFSAVFAIIYIALGMFCYRKIQRWLICRLGVRHTTELVLKDFPLHTLPKCMHPGWYSLFACPIGCSVAVGWNCRWSGTTTALLLELGLCMIGLLLHFLFTNTAHYTRDDVLQSIQQNAMFRRVWSILNFLICLLMAWLVAALHLWLVGANMARSFVLFLPAIIVWLVTGGMLLFSFCFGKRH